MSFHYLSDIIASDGLCPECQSVLVVRFSYHLSGFSQRQTVFYQMVDVMTDIEFHPVADLFPLMQGGEFDELVADIREHGLLEPIWLYEGRILDGRNRWRACQVVGVEPETRCYEGDDPVGFVVSLNLTRRHLDESQRAMVGSKLANMRQGSRTDLQPRANLPEVSNGQAAELMNVSERSIKSAKKIQSKGIPELVSKVEDGDIKVSIGADVADLPEEEQKRLIGLQQKAILNAAKKIRTERSRERRKDIEARNQAYLEEARIRNQMPVSGRCHLLNDDFRTVDMMEESVDVVITDPPYGKEYIDLYASLAVFCQRVLKPGGSLLAMSGQMWLFDVIAALGQSGLNYQWVLAYMTPGGQSPHMFQRKINSFWKPVILMSKDHIDRDWASDVVRSDVNDNDKRLHPWGQSESGFIQLVNKFTVPGQTVCDPMMGAGTTMIAALANGCDIVGIECDELSYHKACDRIRDAS